MDIGNYYSKSVESFRRNWKIAVPSIVASILTGLIFIVGFFEIMAALPLNLNLMGTLITPFIFSQINQNAVITAGVIFIIMEFLLFIINVVRTAATVGMAKQIIIQGSASLDFGWKSGIKYSPKIFVVSIIKTILESIALIPLILGFYLLFAYSLMSAIFVLLAGFIIFLIGAVLLSLIFFLFNQSIVIGQKSIINSIKDSFYIFWDNKLTVFLVALINAVISLGIGFLIGLILTPLTVVTGPIGLQITTQIAGLLVGIVLVPYFALVLTYMYMDLKMGFQWIKGNETDYMIFNWKIRN